MAAARALRARLDPTHPVAAGLQPIHVRAVPAAGITAVASRSHRTPETDAYLARYAIAELVAVGSSLKFCLVAAGEADLYPRLGPTMEWDTAAGHAVLVPPAARSWLPTASRCAMASRSSAIPGSWRAVPSCRRRSRHERLRT